MEYDFLDETLKEALNSDNDSLDISDDEINEYVDSFDTDKPLPANKVVIPEELYNDRNYSGDIYGYIREDSGYHIILGWQGNEPIPEFEADIIGYIGENNSEMPNTYIKGEWVNNELKMTLKNCDDEFESIDLEIDPYLMKQDAFSRNSGLVESDWMDKKCAIISGCGSVGSSIALQLARSGIGRFVLIDTDCMEIHNICRHQCNMQDLGKYKVDALKKYILLINPNAEVKVFYKLVQNVIFDDIKDWISPENTIFIGTCDNRIGNAYTCDAAYEYGVPFVAIGFMTRAWGGEIFTALPEKNDVCYRCAFKKAIEMSVIDERRNHNYIGLEDSKKAAAIPGLDVDLEFGVSIVDKIILDILNRNNENYRPRLYINMKQLLVFSSSADRTFADDNFSRALKKPVDFLNISIKDECRRCEHCLNKE